jgi:hypothetical protein
VPAGAPVDRPRAVRLLPAAAGRPRRVVAVSLAVSPAAREFGGQFGGQPPPETRAAAPERAAELGIRVEAKGLEPSDLLTASQALYQLSYAPGGS